MSAVGLALSLAIAPPPACVREATEALARGETEVAARRGEACHAEEGHAQGLLLASQAWLQAGRLAHARLDAERFLALGTGSKSVRKVAELVRDTATQRSGTAWLAVSPAATGDAGTITATRADPGWPTLRARWDELGVDGDAATLVLDPGAWAVTIARPGFHELTIEVTCAEGQVTTIAADLIPADSGPAPGPATATEAPRRRGRWAIAGGAIGGAAMIGGAAIYAAGFRPLAGVFQGMSCGPDASTDRCRRPIAGLLERTAGGAAMLGAGAGVLVGGLSGLVRDESARHKLWMAEAIVGGVATGGAIALLARGSAYFSTANTDDPWPRALVARGGELYVAGAGLVGAGLGLAATAATGLIVELVQRRSARRTARWRFDGVALRF